MTNKINLIAIIAFVLISLNYGYSQQKQNAGNYSYEVQCLGVEMDGSETVKAWGTGRNRFDAVAQAKKVALRDVLFKGIRKGQPDCNPKPLMTEVNAETKYEDYFNKFFSDKNGEYKDFVSARDERIDDTIFRKRKGATNSVTYSVVVRVLRSELKQKLVNDGIIKK